MTISPAIKPSPLRRALNCRAFRRDEGQALVEFALVLPLILLVVIGIVDFGRAFNYKNQLTGMANSAARYAEVNACSPCSSGETIDHYVENNVGGGLAPPGGGQIKKPACITFTFPSGTSNAGDPLKVTATATYEWLPFLQRIGLSAPTTITSTVTVRLASQYVPTQGLYIPDQTC